MIEYWNSLKRNFLLVLLVSAIAAFIAFLIVGRQGVVNEVHFSYLVSLQQRDNVEEYRFDGFYALQATDLFSTTLATWVMTPGVVAATYEEAGIPLEVKDPRQLVKMIKAEKTAPQLVSVSLRDENADTALSLANALQIVMQRNIDSYQDQGIPAVKFNAVASDTWVGKTMLSVPVIVSGVFLLTLFLSINIILLMTSLRNITD